MPQYTAKDRKILAAEESLWNAYVLLDNIRDVPEWQSRIAQLTTLVEEVARELRHHNDQHETGPDELTATGDQPAAHRGSSCAS